MGQLYRICGLPVNGRMSLGGAFRADLPLRQCLRSLDCGAASHWRLLRQFFGGGYVAVGAVDEGYDFFGIAAGVVEALAVKPVD